MTEYYLSRIELNARKRGARKLLTSPQAMHAAVEASLPLSAREPGKRFLWRVDRHEVRNDLYVVSPGSPDFTHIVEQAGWQSDNRNDWTSKPYDRLLNQLEEGQIWAFRLSANPTHIGRTSDGTAKRFAHVTVNQQVEWLVGKPEQGGPSRAERNGFRIAEEVGRGPAVELVGRSDLTFSRGGAGRQVTIRQAVYEGVLVVSDVHRLRQALTEGIGRAKAYGCGLMTLAPVSITGEG